MQKKFKCSPVLKKTFPDKTLEKVAENIFQYLATYGKNKERFPLAKAPIHIDLIKKGEIESSDNYSKTRKFRLVKIIRGIPVKNKTMQIVMTIDMVATEGNQEF